MILLYFINQIKMSQRVITIADVLKECKDKNREVMWGISIEGIMENRLKYDCKKHGFHAFISNNKIIIAWRWIEDDNVISTFIDKKIYHDYLLN